MALSPNLVDYATDAAGNGTTADVSKQPDDNTHTVIVYNLDGTLSALVGFVPQGTNLTASNSATIPPGGSITYRIGWARFRPCGGIGAGRAVALRLEGVGGTPSVSFQFINSAVEVAP